MVKIKLGDVIDFKNGKSIKKSDGVIPIYGGNGILGYTDKSNFSHTIVVGRVGAYCGSIYVEENSCWVSDNAIAGIPKEGQDLTYLYYVLKSLNLNSKQIGSSQPLITQSMLRDMVVDIEINIEKQKRIANSISIIDQKIQINNQINQELEAMAKTLYDYWFVQFDFPDQNGKPYKSSGGKMVYNPELKREIPEGWGVEKLGDITICHDSKRVPLSRHEREHVKGEIPYYGATGIMDYVNDYIFDGDYVLMAEDGSVMTEKGTPILQRISGKNWVNNHAHVIEPVKNHSCKLLMMLLKDVSVMKIKTGSIQMKINQENMNKIVVPAIPLELLFEINQRLEVIDKQQLNLIEENKQLTQLRDWILPMLMNGQVKVE
ncbi:restriction endonuclease subunit S [Streptococcus thermophilus]|nr:restriction endonuclease subunit S [Streptococcus thermophilus]MCE2218047.1 restriction endonuclease subunit S [Streptococcus thermophilus]MCE2221223.1 restriction endonuclease subunit S [Streptococcus thermophilus]